MKNPPANAGHARDTGSIPGSGRSPGGGNATHSSILAWEIPWTRGAWQATVHGVPKESDTSEQLMLSSIITTIIVPFV